MNAPWVFAGVFAGLAAVLVAASVEGAGAQGGCPLAIADLPGVVFDQSRGRLYAAGPDRVLTAFAAADGAAAWRGVAAQGVLGMVSGKLLVWDRGSSGGNLAFSLLDLSAAPPRASPA